MPEELNIEGNQNTPSAERLANEFLGNVGSEEPAVARTAFDYYSDYIAPIADPAPASTTTDGIVSMLVGTTDGSITLNRRTDADTNLADTLYRSYTRFTNVRAASELIYEEKGPSKSNKMTKKTEYVTLEDSSKKVKWEDAVYVDWIDRYFAKTHPDLVKDYLAEDNYIITSKKYRSKYRRINRVYTDIDENGSLTEPKYTLSDDVYERAAAVHTHENNELEHHTFVDLHLINKDLFVKYYKENVSNGCFYHISLWKRDYGVKQSRIMGRKTKGSDEGVISNNLKPTTYINTFGKRYSFGLEIETCSGHLPQYLDRLMDYSAVHDGSLRDEEGNVYGLEYVTGVLRGDKGLLQGKRLCNELSKRCLVNKQCGVHAHIGDVNFSKENIILMYYLYMRIEDEIFSMLPISRRNNEYCRKLTPIDIDLNLIKSNYKFYIDKYYNDIIKLLAQTDVYNKDINKKKDHPKGHKCGYDHSAHRYCWVNFIPAVFNTRGNEVYTIEFRPMSATTSYYKIKNWLMVCMALVDVVENHKGLIYDNPMLNLSQIIKAVYPKNYMKLLDHIEKRINKFASKDEDVETSDYIDNEVDDQILIKNL